MRLFVAIPLAAPVVEELSAIRTQLQSSGDGLRWTTAESWHITLQFLGNTDQTQYACAAERLRGVRSVAVEIALKELDFFDRAGVFFAGVQMNQELTMLQQRVSAATKLCGFEAEDRAFHPHITLARSKGDGKRDGLIALRSKLHGQTRFTRYMAGDFILYESFLGSGSPRHEVRGRFALKVD